MPDLMFQNAAPDSNAASRCAWMIRSTPSDGTHLPPCLELWSGGPTTSKDAAGAAALSRASSRANALLYVSYVQSLRRASLVP